MNKKGWLIAAGVTVVASAPLFTIGIPLSIPTLPPSQIYSGLHDFIHKTGMHHLSGWEADYRVHRPGYVLSGLANGGEPLPEGTYRYDFFFVLRSGHMASLLGDANDVVRLEVADLTTRDILTDQTFQMADFKGVRKGYVRKSITFSTAGRKSHLFEPRLYWQGLSGIYLGRVERMKLEDASASLLKQKAADFERMMPMFFLERGYVVVRDPEGKAEDTGDTAIWTGLYAAAEAWRYKTTQDREAEKNLERSLWALHALAHSAPVPGTLVRYVKPDGTTSAQEPSKDTYTGFFYGVAQALPYVKDAALKKALQADLENLAGHFLDHDLAFVSPSGSAVDMNPYPNARFVAEASRDLQENAGLRRDLIKTLKLARWYFWVHGQSAPPEFGRFITLLKHPHSARYEEELLPLANAIRQALRLVQHNVHRSAERGTRQGLTDSPYMKLDLLLLRSLHSLDMESGNRDFSSLSELKILPSQSLHALHFLKVAGEALPKPNRYDTYYRANLFEGKKLLQTAVRWHQIDEDALSIVLGQTETDTRRTSSSHLSYLALHDLILLEKDPIVCFKYQKLFEEQFQPMRHDENAMIDAMQAAVGLSTKQLGLAWHALSSYPVDRRGKGYLYWKENRDAMLEAFGGVVNDQAREVVPADLRPRDAFLWQRSAHSISGDQKDWLYPPLDYLFVYWLATNSATLDAVSEKS